MAVLSVLPFQVVHMFSTLCAHCIVMVLSMKASLDLAQFKMYLFTVDSLFLHYVSRFSFLDVHSLVILSSTGL